MLKYNPHLYRKDKISWRIIRDDNKFLTPKTNTFKAQINLEIEKDNLLHRLLQRLLSRIHHIMNKVHLLFNKFLLHRCLLITSSHPSTNSLYMNQWLNWRKISFCFCFHYIYRPSSYLYLILRRTHLFTHSIPRPIISLKLQPQTRACPLSYETLSSISMKQFKVTTLARQGAQPDRGHSIKALRWSKGPISASDLRSPSMINLNISYKDINGNNQNLYPTISNNFSNSIKFYIPDNISHINTQNDLLLDNISHINV